MLMSQMKETIKDLAYLLSKRRDEPGNPDHDWELAREILESPYRDYYLKLLEEEKK